MQYSEPNPAISSTHAAPTGKLFCVNCGSPILVGARICAVCKSYQSQWRNTLLFVGSIAGFITLFASGVTFIFAQLSSIIKTEKIAVSYLSYPGELLLINTGDKEVFVSSLEVYWNNRNHNERISLNASIKPGEFKSITPAFFDPRTDAIVATPQSEFETYIWIVNRSGEPNDKLFAVSAPHKKGECIIYSFISSNHFDIVRINDHYSSRNLKLVTASAEAHLNWVSSSTGKLTRTQIPDVLISFRFRPEAGCNEKDWNELEQ